MRAKFYFVLMYILFFCTVVHAGAVNQVLKIKISNIESMEANFSYVVTDKAYVMAAIISTSGMFAKVYPFDGMYNALGRIKSTTLIPVKYTNSTKSRFNTRKKEYIYDDNGYMTRRTAEKNEKLKEFEIDPEESKSSTNLPTAFTNLLLQLKDTGTCASTYDVFNGKRHFKVIFKDHGYDNLVDKDNPFVDGLSIKCSMYIESAEVDNDNLLFNASTGKPVSFWIKKDVDSGLPYIVRIETRYSKFGKIVAYPEEIKIKDR